MLFDPQRKVTLFQKNGSFRVVVWAMYVQHQINAKTINFSLNSDHNI